MSRVVLARRRRSVLAVGATLGAALLLLPGCSGGGPATGPTVPVTTAPGPYDYEYVIPAGTGAMLDSGARPAVFPTSLDVKVGETIRIVNNDDRGHTMGTFYVLANSTLAYRFSTPGTFIGDCSLNPGEEFVLTVRE